MGKQKCHALLAALVVLVFAGAPMAAQARSSDTVMVLTEALKGELYAQHAYLAFAKKASEEKYVRIGALFTALSVSEGIHARNFAQALAKLGATANQDRPDIVVADTRANLKKAADAELQEIDVKYPNFLKRVRAENQDDIAKVITWAWQAEKQHRDLVTQLQTGAATFFGMVVNSIEGNKVAYFVCQACGSTLVEMPKGKCPNCGSPASVYTKVEGTGV